MKKTLTIILTIILLISILVLGFACRKEAPKEESAGKTAEETLIEEDIEQSQEATKEKAIDETFETEDEDIEEATNTEVSIEEADQNANYNIEFDATWSSSSHPDNYVSSAHFSPFVVYSYDGTTQGRIFTIGSTSTPGMEDMAETGATGILEEEINQIIEAKNALSYFKAQTINSPGQIEVTLEFSQEFNHFIFVSMIAPSPDWFVTAEANLFIEGQWVDQLILDVISFDAGTDSGDSLTAANSDTNPKQPITLFDEDLQKLGLIIVTRT